jgi:hypothetical protein
VAAVSAVLSHRKRKMTRLSHRVRLVALFTCVASCLLIAGYAAAHAQRTQAPDFDALKRLPSSEVIRLGTLRYVVPANAPAHATDRDGTLAKLRDLDPALRRLVLLEFLVQFARPDLKWEADDREHLVYFFDLWWGDFAPEVRDALHDVGLEVQSNVLSEAITLFGPDYPLHWGKQRDAQRLERPLAELDRKFGSQPDYLRALEDYVLREPKLAQWAADMRLQITDDERLTWLMRHLVRAVDLGAPHAVIQRQLVAMPRPYQQLFLLGTLNRELMSENLYEFFSGISGNVAPEVLQVLRELSVDKHAAVFEQSMAMFPSPYPTNAKQRNDFIDSPLSPSRRRVIDERLSHLSYELEQSAMDALDNAMMALAEREGLLPK